MQAIRNAIDYLRKPRKKQPQQGLTPYQEKLIEDSIFFDGAWMFDYFPEYLGENNNLAVGEGRQGREGAESASVFGSLPRPVGSGKAVKGDD